MQHKRNICSSTILFDIDYLFKDLRLITCCMILHKHAVYIQDSFGLDNLKMTERPDPVPGPGEVKLRMRAASLNYRDLLMVTGNYNPKQPLPLIPCSDGVGEVVAVGNGKKLDNGEVRPLDVKVGDKVNAGQVVAAVEAMKAGAYDYLTKPCETEELIKKIMEAYAKRPAL